MTHIVRRTTTLTRGEEDRTPDQIKYTNENVIHEKESTSLGLSHQQVINPKIIRVRKVYIFGCLFFIQKKKIMSRNSFD